MATWIIAAACPLAVPNRLACERLRRLGAGPRGGFARRGVPISEGRAVNWQDTC
ncbi:MAG: hypothetical protein ACHQ4H_07150 [Ktedonobacterales bacterium]